MPTQTPASRKFILPSSTAPSRSQKQHGFASQFSRPSHTSSSPYIRTPFSSTVQNQGKDEIVADDSADDDDADKDHDDHDSRHPLADANFVSKSPEVLPNLTDDDFLSDDSHEEITTRLTPPSQSRRSQRPHVRSNKRRKISHPNSASVDNELDLSSVPSSPIREVDGLQPHEAQLHVPHSSPPPPVDDELAPESPQSRSTSPTCPAPTSPAQDFQTPKHHKSRFRDPLPGFASSTPSFHAASHPVVYPSFQSRLLASTSTSSNANPTTTSPGPHIRGPHPTLDLTLPDAFSPSRKRGAREYIYGGIAETVRGWVVDLATMAAGHAATPPHSSTRNAATIVPNTLHNDDHDHDNHTATGDTKGRSHIHSKFKILVREVLLTDTSGRFILIQSHSGSTSATDHHDVEFQHNGIWMLINTNPQSRRTGGSGGISRADTHSRLTGVQPGKTVNIRGGDAMTWDLDLNLNLTMKEDTANNPNQHAPMTCKVAVLWDVT